MDDGKDEMSVWLDDRMDGQIQGKSTKWTDLSPVHNAQVCVHLTVHITKLQLQTTVLKPLYI
jgi:hypothetical protein